MAKKELIRQNLDKFPVLIDDKSAFSPDYLRITKLPTEFSAGTNIIKFKGNTALFSDEAEFLVEVLDSNNDPVYYEVGLDLESAEQSGVITVYINQDTAPGPAILYICTTIKQDIQKNFLDVRRPNLRWSAAINIDPSKRNEAEILFETLPSVSIFSSSGSYTNLAYNGSRVTSNTYNIAATPLLYFNYNNMPALMTGSNSTFAFSSSAATSGITIYSTYLTNSAPTKTNVANGLIFSASIVGYSGSGIAYLDIPVSYPITNANATYIATAGKVTEFTYNVEQSSTGVAGTTENSYNVVVAYFTGVTPQVGAVSKIRSYYKSSGVGEYIFSNETIVSSTDTEFGFTPSIVSMSFTVPTMQRNDKLDFKFEFVNPTGLVSKQIIESKNHSFIGGNTYIGGDDNLLTGSLYVAGNTGTGVHISGKGSSAMIRSIGYAGFQKATTIGPGGFVMYSGSIQPLLNSTEEYSGVGLELVANSASYFKYTTSGSGLLDIRTAAFFLGSDSQYVSGSNGNIAISSSNFYLDANGNVTLSGAITVTNTDDYTTPRAKSTYITALISSGSISYPNFATETNPIFTSNGYPSAIITSVTGSDKVSDISSSFDLYVIDHAFFNADLRGQLILNLFDAGYSVLSVGNDTYVANITGSAGSEWPIIDAVFKTGGNFTSSSKATGIGGVSPNDPISFGWSHFFTRVEGDGGYLPTKLKTNMNGASTCVPLAVSGGIQANNVPDLNTSAAYVAFYATNPRGGRWVHTNARELAYGLHPSASVKLLDFLYRRDNAQEAYHDGFTKITGNMIQTGKIQSTNWTVGGTVGSEFNLNNGTFKLGGDVNPEFSWDGTNLRVSGSSTELITPSFLLGDQSTFISGSNGKILISGSSVDIRTPSFNLGTSASYISGSSGKVDIYSNKFIVTGEGIVTASGVFIPKVLIDGSTGLADASTVHYRYGLGIVPMIEPERNFIDASNIGRTVYSDQAEYSYTKNVGGAQFSPMLTASFHTLPHETHFVIPHHAQLTINGSVAVTTVASMYIDMYYALSSSVWAAEPGYDIWATAPANAYLNRWPYSGTPENLSFAASGPPFPAATRAVGTYYNIVSGRNLAVIALPNEVTASGGFVQLRIDHNISHVPAGDTTIVNKCKYINVMVGRLMGLNFKKHIIGTPVFSAIGAPPAPPPVGGPGDIN